MEKTKWRPPCNDNKMADNIMTSFRDVTRVLASYHVMLLTSLPVMTWPWGVAMGRCHCTHTHMVKTIPREKNSSKQRNDAMKKKKKFNGGNVAKHWNVAGRGI